MILVQKNRAAAVCVLIYIVCHVKRVVSVQYRLVHNAVDCNPPNDIRVFLDEGLELFLSDPNHLKETMALCWRQCGGPLGWGVGNRGWGYHSRVVGILCCLNRGNSFYAVLMEIIRQFELRLLILR